MDAYDASLLYRGYKLHFTSEKYDVLRFNGKVKGDTIAARQRFLQTKQRHFYSTLARHADPRGLLVSNFIVNPKAFIVDIVTDSGYNHYTDWVRRNSQLYYNFSQELEHFESVKDFKAISGSGIPLLIEKYIEKQISPETVCIIDACTQKLDEWVNLTHPLLEQTILKLRKYRSFVQINRQKIKQSLQRHYGVYAK